jgi:hypothetical protein
LGSLRFGGSGRQSCGFIVSGLIAIHAHEATGARKRHRRLEGFASSATLMNRNLILNRSMDRFQASIRRIKAQTLILNVSMDRFHVSFGPVLEEQGDIDSRRGDIDIKRFHLECIHGSS